MNELVVNELVGGRPREDTGDGAAPVGRLEPVPT